MWPSISPLTRPNAVEPFAGVPVAFNAASGYTAHPVAGVIDVFTVFAPDFSVQASPACSTLQSLGEACTPAAVTNVPSGR